jgi:hypothetical protein
VSVNLAKNSVAFLPAIIRIAHISRRPPSFFPFIPAPITSHFPPFISLLNEDTGIKKSTRGGVWEARCRAKVSIFYIQSVLAQRPMDTVVFATFCSL